MRPRCSKDLTEQEGGGYKKPAIRHACMVQRHPLRPGSRPRLTALESVTAGRPGILQTRTEPTMTTERRPSLHPLYTSASRLNASQPSHGLPTPVSPGPFHFDKLSSVSTPTPKAIPVSSQRFAHYRDGPRRPCDPPAPLAQHPDWHQNLQRSPTVAELDKQDKSKRPVRLRRGSSLLRLQLDAAKERDVSLIFRGM